MSEFERKRKRLHTVNGKQYKFSVDDMEWVQQFRNNDWDCTEQIADKLSFVRTLDKQSAFIKGALVAFIASQFIEYLFNA